MGQALYRKWRPRDWGEVVGQDAIITTLKNAVASQHVGHAYLFAGPRGTGKTTTARLFAKAINCQVEDITTRPCNQCQLCLAVNENRMLDLIEIDAASNTSVDDIRELREKVNFSPSLGKFKIYIIDEVHMLSNAAFNALLKTLEEPPAHIIFILATTEIQKIPATVLSRCQRFDFRRIPLLEIVPKLKTLAKGENIQVDEEALDLIARQATGSMRDAISLLDQLASTGEHVTLELTRQVLGTSVDQSVVALVDAIIQNQVGAGLDVIHDALDAGGDPRQYARQVVDHLRDVLMCKMGNPHLVGGNSESIEILDHQSSSLTTQRLLDLISRFNSAALDSRNNWQPGLSLELALAGAVLGQANTAPVVPLPQTPSGNTTDKTMPVATKTQPVTPKPVQTPSISVSPPVQDSETSAGSESSNINQEVTLAQINQNWSAIRMAVKKKRGQTEGLLNSCQPLGIKDGALVLGFASDILQKKMEIAENISITEQALEEVLGRKLSIRCALANSKPNNLPRDHEIASDGMVGTALRDLGGEVVDFH
jgi:DNA polymerase III subunit gamma/tau